MIEVKDLTQVYKSGKGIFDLNFSIKEGEVFGYLGPNGAGKTTTIRNLLGFANRVSGTVEILGKDSRKYSASLQKDIGYLPGEIAFFENFSGKEFLDFMCKMRGTTNLNKREELIELFELEVNVPIRKMSKGMKQKLGIVTAFMHDPKILILDEPTSGLDPLMQNIFLDLLMEEKAKGKTVLMSSHIFEEVERVCDRAGIIKDGRIITIEDFKSLKEKKEDTFVVTIDGDAKGIFESGLNVVELPNNKYQIGVRDYSKFFKVLSKYNVTSLSEKHQSIEDIFMKYYSKDGEGNE